MERTQGAGPLTEAVLGVLPGGERERERYQTLLITLDAWRHLFTGQRVLDFGASWGTSMVALLELGAREVAGVEPDSARVRGGRTMLATVAPDAPLSLAHVQDTATLPFGEGEFHFILANAVFEHIPQPRAAFIRELWRVLSPGGCLMINETPNKYFPREVHTTGLWFNHWLPCRVAHSRAVRLGRFDANRTDWTSSGWRGLGFYEMVASIGGYRLIPEQTKVRHRVLSHLGLPASMLDPYPTWVLLKQ